MEVSGNYTLYAPRERVWEALLDPETLKRTVPGCESLERVGDDSYHVRVNIGLAAVKGVYEGTLKLLDLQRPEHYHMIVDGKGARGVLHGDGTLTLEARDPTTTVVHYQGEAQLGGPIAGVGMRVAGGAANVLIKAYFSRLADALADGTPVASGAESAAGAPTAGVLSADGEAQSLQMSVGIGAVADAALPPPTPGGPFMPAADATPGAPLLPSLSVPAAPVVSLAPAAPLAVAASPAPSTPPAAASVSAAATIPAAARRGALLRFVRRAGLTDGSLESERRWARGLVGGAVLVAAIIVVVVAFLIQHH